MKGLGLLISEKKNFVACLLCSYMCVQNCDPRGGASFDPRASYEQTWQRSTKRCYIPNIKALRLPVSERKNFEDGLQCSGLCSNFLSPGQGQFLPQGHHYEQNWKKSTRRYYIPNMKTLDLPV